MTNLINNAIKKVKAKLGLRKVSDSDLLKAANTAYDGLLNNPAFSNTPVALPVFRQALDTYNTLIVSAEDGGKKAISAKQNQRLEVLKMYTLLGHYVEATCGNDLATFHTSGFTAVAKIRTSPQALGPARFRLIDRGPNSGQTVVKVESQSGALAFDVRYALDGGGGSLVAWSTLTLTSSKKVAISGLTPAGTYQFQVRALGKLGYTDWSPPLSFIAA